MELGELLGGAGSIFQVIVGVSLLIFIHEAGHFFAAKWAKVEVLVFSLGFGPEMVGITRGTTRYRVSWIPLGGYVKMSGEVERPEGGFGPNDYPSQPVWRRAIIIGAGVAMNAVLGFVLFAGALLWGMPKSPVAVRVEAGEPAWEAGLRTGDRVLAAGGQRVLDFEDIVYATLDGEPVTFEAERDGRRFEVTAVPRTIEKTPRVGVGPMFTGAIEVPPGGKAEAAGLRTGDRVVEVEGVPAEFGDLEDAVFVQAVLPPSGPLRIVVRRGTELVALSVPPWKEVPSVGIASLRTAIKAVRQGSPASAAGWRPGDCPVAVGGTAVRGAATFFREAMRAPPSSAVRVERIGGPADLPLPDAPRERLELLRDLLFAASESETAVEVLPGSPAEAAGIPSGARITAVAGAKVAKWADVVDRISKAGPGSLDLKWAVDGGERDARLSPSPRAQHVLEVGLLPEGVVRAGSPGEALSMAARRCVLTTRHIGATLSGIFRGSVDKGNLGGPVLIARVTFRMAKEGFGHFLWILAVLSINLMFLNVLPIPLLDGGQLALLAVEAVTRRPPSQAVVGFTQMAGLVFLLGVLLFVTFNDIARLVGG